MEKENSFKNILLKSLIGLPIGITLLLISYISIYPIAGEEVFKLEISILQNINILIYQMLASSLSYYLFFTTINVFYYLANKEKHDNYSANHPYRIIILSLICGLILASSIIFLSFEKIFTTNIAVINNLLFLIIFAIYSFFYLIKCFKDSKLIKIINEKIKERNQ